MLLQNLVIFQQGVQGVKAFPFSVVTVNDEPTIIRKIFETNSGFHVKQRHTGKVQFLFFSSFWLVLKNFSFWH